MTSADHGSIAYSPLLEEDSNPTKNSLGKTAKIQILSILDYAAVVACLVLLALAELIVYHQDVAVALGQKYQLTLVGLLLTLQGFCMSRQVLLCAIRYEARSGPSTLQNLNALLLKALFDEYTSISVRALILSVVGLPALLGVLYNQAYGGSTTKSVSGPTGLFGITAIPSLDGLRGSDGIALATHVMTPFWQDPQKNNTSYGENMLVLDGNTTAMLDLPHPTVIKEMREMRRNLGHGEHLILDADINATVATNVPIPATEQHDFAAKFDDPGPDNQMPDWAYWRAGLGQGWWAGMVLGGTPDQDFAPAKSPTVNYLGIWRASHKTASQTPKTFSSAAQKTLISRRLAHARWSIFPSNITLVSSYLDGNKPGQASAPTQGPVDTKVYQLNLFGQLFQEYNYQTAGHLEFSPISTFVAAIAWARLATVRHYAATDSNWAFVQAANYTKTADEYELRLVVPTMMRSWWVGVILAVNPALVIAATISKAYLYKTPVSDGFGLISLLSSAKVNDLSTFYGAGLSGELKRAVRVSFNVDKDKDTEHGRVRVHFNSQGTSDLLKPKVTYA